MGNIRLHNQNYPRLVFCGSLFFFFLFIIKRVSVYFSEIRFTALQSIQNTQIRQYPFEFGPYHFLDSDVVRQRFRNLFSASIIVV